jgi:hypothetical protein
VRFIWFWTFWHWSKESFEAGALLRSPLHGIGSHWDEWFRHEASPSDRHAIEVAGRTKRDQRQFVSWLVRRWTREAEWRGTRPPARFVLAQLASVAPFDHWLALEKYRETYGVSGVSAIVVAEDSVGDATDVRVVEAIALPADADAAAGAILTEGFDADPETLTSARKAASSLLAGHGLSVFLALWLAAGRRPYPRALRVLLTLGWVAAAGLIVRLLVGSDPGVRLLLYDGLLLGVWTALAGTALVASGAVTLSAWRLGRRWNRELAASQIRLRMNGGLRLQGGSAEVPFCLNTLLALHRAHAGAGSESWLWREFFQKLRTDASSWAGTGVIAPGGRVEPVVIEPKLRAAIRHGSIAHLLTPRQREASHRSVERVMAEGRARATRTVDVPAAPGIRVGFAAELPRLRTYRCRHVAQAVMAIGDFTSMRQMAVNALAVAVSLVMLVALPDVWSILHPPPAPVVVGPSSASPYLLWVSLATNSPDDFTVLLESNFWANRRGEVAWHGGPNASVRAELALNRLGRQRTPDQEDGTVWVERRRKFLGREYMPGERVCRYSLAYIARLAHD